MPTELFLPVDDFKRRASTTKISLKIFLILIMSACDRFGIRRENEGQNPLIGHDHKSKVAITLARNAQIHMLDEPFNGIDWWQGQ